MNQVEAYVAKLLRRALQGFLGQQNKKSLMHEVSMCTQRVLANCVEQGIIDPGHRVQTRMGVTGDNVIIDILPPPGVKSECTCHFTLAPGGMEVEDLPQNRVQEPRGGPMTKDELLVRIASETGIPVNRLLIERCNHKFTLSVDVLNGTEDERWAAAAVLHKYRPAATEAHVSAPRDYTNCSLCGTRLKVVELTRKGKVQAKSRCPNTLCKNSHHWMPSYRPETVVMMPPRVAMTFEATEKAMAAVAGFKDVEEMRKKIALGMQVPEKYLQGNYSSSLWAEEYYKKSTDLEHLSKTLKKLAKENGINITTSKAPAREGDQVFLPPVENRFATTGRVSSKHPNEAMPPQEEYDEVTISGIDLNDKPISEVVRVPKGGGTVITRNRYKTYSFTPPYPGECKFTVGVDKARDKDETVFKREYLGEFPPAETEQWPIPMTPALVGRTVRHRRSGGHFTFLGAQQDGVDGILLRNGGTTFVVKGLKLLEEYELLAEGLKFPKVQQY